MQEGGPWGSAEVRESSAGDAFPVMHPPARLLCLRLTSATSLNHRVFEIVNYLLALLGLEMEPRNRCTFLDDDNAPRVNSACR